MPSEPPEDDEDGKRARPRFTSIEGDLPVLVSMSEYLKEEIQDFEFQAPISGLVPLRVVQPIYPLKAAYRQIEGEVTIEFSVSDTGHVINPMIVSAEPEKIFDKAALSAIQKFTFTPPSIDGQTYQASGIKLKFFFKLEDELPGMISGSRS